MLVETGCGRIHREPWLARSICILTKQSLNLVAALETVLQRSRRHRRNNVLKIPSSMPTIIFFFIVSLSAQNFFFSFFLRSIREKLRLSEELSSRNDIISLLLRKFAPKRSFNDLFLFHCKTCCCFRRQRINNCYAPVFQSKVFYLWN